MVAPVNARMLATGWVLLNKRVKAWLVPCKCRDAWWSLSEEAGETAAPSHLPGHWLRCHLERRGASLASLLPKNQSWKEGPITAVGH